VVIFYEYAINEDAESFVKSQLLCFEIAVFVNLLTIVMYPAGLYNTESELNLFVSNKNWFLGFYNNVTKYYLPAIMFAFINVYLGGKKSRLYLLLVAIAISSVLTWSGGVLVAVSFSILFILLGRKYTQLFNYANCWFVQPIALVLVLGVKIQNIFRWFLDSFLDKWNSLQLRINLWLKVCEYIVASPIIGYGVETAVVRELKVGMDWATHAHNLILEILYQGGLIYFVLFALMICLCGRRIMKNKHSYVAVVISAAFGGWAVDSIVEPFMSPFLMGLFIVGYYSDRIINAGVGNNAYEFITSKLREVEKSLTDIDY
jgi:O-antigen ligase